MTNFKYFVYSIIFLTTHIKTMDIVPTNQTTLPDQRLVLELLCYRIDIFNYDDIMAMSLVHKNMANILTKTANVRREYLKQAMQIEWPATKFYFDLVTFHPFGCTAVWLVRHNLSFLAICSMWLSDKDSIFIFTSTHTPIIHNYTSPCSVEWKNNSAYAQITKSDLHYTIVHHPKFENGAFVVRAIKQDGEITSKHEMIINQSFVKKYQETEHQFVIG